MMLACGCAFGLFGRVRIGNSALCPFIFDDFFDEKFGRLDATELVYECFALAFIGFFFDKPDYQFGFTPVEFLSDDVRLESLFYLQRLIVEKAGKCQTQEHDYCDDCD